MADVTRERVHTRTITLDGYARSDGLIDVEGEIKDVKTYDFPNAERGVIKAHEALHHMKVRIAVDQELTIKEAEATTLSGPYAICPSANIGFDALIGLTIGPGWRNKSRQAIGGITGCTHITELMGPVATVAIQTLYGEQARQRRRQGIDDTKAHDVSSLANSCIGHAEDSQAALDLAQSRKTR
ncbi:MAG: DUF2889 domain-containing protein [Alphaproteobacteria bacterium]|nr:DUF2889 domain-containing protein [Alphaproteobacteria bacterium]